MGDNDFILELKCHRKDKELLTRINRYVHEIIKAEKDKKIMIVNSYNPLNPRIVTIRVWRAIQSWQ